MSEEDSADDGDLDQAQRQAVSELSTEQIAAIDRALLANVPRRWRKMAWVVGHAMFSLDREEFRGVPDLFFAERLRALARNGRLESVGNLRRMHYCEVRTCEPRDPHDSVEAKINMISPGQYELIRAIEAGDIARAREFVVSGGSVEESDGYGWSLLHRAAQHDRVELIEFLIEQGATLERRGTDDWTPLHLACVSGRVLAVAALVRAGADVNSIAHKGNTPLHLALICRSREMLETLVGAGADPTLEDSRGRTPAAVAREGGLAELAELLESRKPGPPHSR